MEAMSVAKIAGKPGKPINLSTSRVRRIAI